MQMDERKNSIFWLAVISLIASLPCLRGYTAGVGHAAYIAALNMGTAGISYVCFRRIFEGREIGIVCSALYTLSVFRICRLYVIGAAGESAAIAFLPLVLYGLYRIFTENPEEKGYRTAWVPFMLGASGAIWSHVQSCGILCLAVAVFCAAYMRKLFSRGIFPALLKGILSTLLVSLWALVPYGDRGLLWEEAAQAQGIQDRGLYFAQLAFHFWTLSASPAEGKNGMQHSSPAGVGLILTAALGIFLILWFSGKIREPDERIGFAKITAASGLVWLFMSTRLFPWNRLQSISSVTRALIGRLEYPDRLLGWGAVCLTLVFGFCLWYFESSGRQFCYYLMVGAAVIGITTSSMHLLDCVGIDGEIPGLYYEEGAEGL